MLSPLSRRSMIRWSGSLTVLLALGLAGCGSDADELANQVPEVNEQGYISGAGVITQLPIGERGEPIELAGEYTDGTAFDLADWRGAPVVLNLRHGGQAAYHRLSTTGAPCQSARKHRRCRPTTSGTKKTA